jgi:hypothetical protein
LPYFSKFSATCAASSRVGSRISERGEDIDHWQHEAGCLAGTGLGNADKVLAHQDRWDRALLDGSRDVIPAIGDSAKQLVRKAEIGKRHR